MAAVQEACLSEQTEVGVGGETIGAERDADTPGQEFAEWVRRVSKGGVRTRTIDECAVGGNPRCCGEVIAMDKEVRLGGGAELNGPPGMVHESVWRPHVEVLQERHERPASVAQEVQLCTRLGQMDG